MKRIGRANGFSLIEVAVSISLFILLVGLIVANISFLNRYLVRAEINKMYNVFRFLQKSAMVSGQDKVLEFDIEKRQYRYGKKIFTLPAQVAFDVVPGAKGPPSGPKKEIRSPVTFKGKKATFKKNGIIGSGTVYITDAGKHIMYAISSSVAQVSYLRKYMYSKKWTPIT